jgi:hypothetical protein
MNIFWTNEIKVDKNTIDTLAALDMFDIPGLVQAELQPVVPTQVFSFAYKWVLRCLTFEDGT